MGDVVAGGKVDFDFKGSLELARLLWQLADDLVEENSGREGNFDTAMAKFEGPYATQLRGRRVDERTSKGNVAQGLRDDARSWAKAWATAMDQQNKNNRAAKVEQVREDRNLLEKGWDSTFGKDNSDEEVPHAEAVDVPQPPLFAETADLKEF